MKYVIDLVYSGGHGVHGNRSQPSYESWFVLVPMVYMRFFSALMSSFCVTTLMCLIPVIAMTHLISEVHLALTISNN